MVSSSLSPHLFNFHLTSVEPYKYFLSYSFSLSQSQILAVFFWPIAGGGTWYEYNNILNKFRNDNVVDHKDFGTAYFVSLGGSF